MTRENKRRHNYVEVACVKWVSQDREITPYSILSDALRAHARIYFTVRESDVSR